MTRITAEFGRIVATESATNRQKCSTIVKSTSAHHHPDSAGISDIGAWIRIENYEIGVLASVEGAEVGLAPHRTSSDESCGE